MNQIQETIYDLTHVDDDIQFELWTRALKNPIYLTETSWDMVSENFMFDKDVKFVTHGWLANGQSEVCTSIRDGYLKKADINVIIVDWGKISQMALYPVSMETTKAIGDHYGKFLNFLVGKGVQLDKIHLIGHSLGAHVSGFAARCVTQGKVSRVSGLDPALPGFNLPGESNHLNSDDAEFVDIIHTCAGVLGMLAAIGHADFYPNGGTTPQPGLLLHEEVAVGSHSRAWEYFAESIDESRKFMGYKCNSWISYMLSWNKTGDTPMGDPAPRTARGCFYLQTNGSSPYAMN